jgi:hypothetical protein
VGRRLPRREDSCWTDGDRQSVRKPLTPAASQARGQQFSTSAITNSLYAECTEWRLADIEGGNLNSRSENSNGY